MANNSTGKWVQRAATTGGGRTYRGQMPVNWYASLVLICVVGLFLVGLSRYQLTHRSTSSSGPPTTSQTWYAALGHRRLRDDAAQPAGQHQHVKTGLTANGNGVVTIHPKNSSESGSNATLGKFVRALQGARARPTRPSSTRARRPTRTVTSARRARPTPASRAS